MSYLLFVDESGIDKNQSPYEVLAGVAISDRELWALVSEIQEAELSIFGSRISGGPDELKARKLLKRKTFRLAAQLPPIEFGERKRLIRDLLASPDDPTKAGLTAYSQAKLEFVSFILQRAQFHQVRAFATIVSRDARRPLGRTLRKDYAYLFERFFHFVDRQPTYERGLVVFDELERSRAHILVDQMAEYFQHTLRGRERAARIVPEPLFVHSDLTTLIQVADIVAYVISWNVRVGRMSEPTRPELDGLRRHVMGLREDSITTRQGYPDGFRVRGFAYIEDLRPRFERENSIEARFGREFDAEIARLTGGGES